MGRSLSRGSGVAVVDRTATPAPSFEGDFVDRFLDLVDDHVGQLGPLFAVQALR
jgi:hypothetical protein